MGVTPGVTFSPSKPLRRQPDGKTKMTKLNKRFALEGATDESQNIVDLYTQQKVGDFWLTPTGAWTFVLADGRSRFGGFTPVLKSLRLMLRGEA
jgi:hypothetical protein